MSDTDITNQIDTDVVVTVDHSPPATVDQHAPATAAPDVQAILQRAHMTEDMAAVEALLLERSASQSPHITDAGAYVIRAGGKRLRAAQSLLAARLGAYNFAQARHAAATVEFIHTASLVHDDLVDHSQQRRGQTTVHARWDNDVALMVGDYFFALAAAEMALCHDRRIVTYYAQAVQTVVSGELHPVTDVEPFDTAMEQYLRKTGAKTAALFEAGCKAGLATSGASEEAVTAVGRYGYDLGIAFQIVDDVLDFTSSEQVMGKPAGNDLREGTITLPLIYAFAEQRNPFLRDIVKAGAPADADVARAVAEVIQAGGVRKARADAERYVQQAICHLEQFPPSPARRALEELARFVVERYT
jgi:heptaprenyl diphosphate synthase/octaprenyl-diphosphate synthase